MKINSTAKRLISVGITLIVSGLAISCVPDTTAPVLQPRRTPTTAPEAVSAKATPTFTALKPFTDQACLKCHTDEKNLKALAVVKPAAESLSSGPG